MKFWGDVFFNKIVVKWLLNLVKDCKMGDTSKVSIVGVPNSGGPSFKPDSIDYLILLLSSLNYAKGWVLWVGYYR